MPIDYICDQIKDDLVLHAITNVEQGKWESRQSEPNKSVTFAFSHYKLVAGAVAKKNINFIYNDHGMQIIS